MFSAKNGRLRLDDTDMDYIRFGSGERVLIVLPGLGDGLRTVQGTALPMALMFRTFAKDYTVYMFSRRSRLPEGFATRDMAADQKQAMDLLGIRRADVLGVSMGGMIAQHLAADWPETVGKLVLTVTSAGPNPMLTGAVTGWLEQAGRGDHTALMDSNVKLIYSDAYYRRNRWLVPIMGKVSKPRSYDRFFVQANACLTHCAYDRLSHIQAPTLVIGGERDAVVGGDASRELCALIPGARLLMYPEQGHGLYEEERGFQRAVLEFLRSQ